MNIERIKNLIEDADYMIVGAGAGLSTAAGLEYSGERFEKNFKEYIKKYKITDMYSGGFYPFESLEEKWGYWAKQLDLEINEKATELYKKLYKLLKDKNYFIITTNVDEQFQKAGFPEEKIYETQGRYNSLQCSVPCHNKLYEASPHVKLMIENIKDLKVPTEYIPKCPVCNEPLDTNLRIDNRFVEDVHWHEQNKKYYDFLENAKEYKTVLLEFGIGFNTPSIIRFPFESLTMELPNWTLIRFNKDNFEIGVNIDDSIKLLPLEFLEEYDMGNGFKNRYIPVLEDINIVLDDLLDLNYSFFRKVYTIYSLIQFL